MVSMPRSGDAAKPRLYNPAMVDLRAPLAAAQSRLFDAMPVADSHAVLTAAGRRSLRKGEVLLRQGEPAATFFLMERGYLKLTQLTAEGAEVIVRFVGPRDPVGGVAALGEAPYPVTAVACDTVEVLAWSRGQFTELLDRYPRLKTNILREMTAHMDDALTRLRELATLSVRQRLAHTLLRLTKPLAPAVEGGAAIPHTLTRQELAELTGTTLFTVSRILTGWEGDGCVHSTRAHVAVLDPERLRAAADGDGD
jgi:CRP/FNR family transcriptional regulator, nitrogen oxide reductase regulator